VVDVSRDGGEGGSTVELLDYGPRPAPGPAHCSGASSAGAAADITDIWPAGQKGAAAGDRLCDAGAAPALLVLGGSGCAEDSGGGGVGDGRAC